MDVWTLYTQTDRKTIYLLYIVYVILESLSASPWSSKVHRPPPPAAAFARASSGAYLRRVPPRSVPARRRPCPGASTRYGCLRHLSFNLLRLIRSSQVTARHYHPHLSSLNDKNIYITFLRYLLHLPIDFRISGVAAFTFPLRPPIPGGDESSSALLWNIFFVLLRGFVCNRKARMEKLLLMFSSAVHLHAQYYLA